MGKTHPQAAIPEQGAPYILEIQHQIPPWAVHRVVRAAPCRAHPPLTSQTYGSKNLLRVGVILQRAILILLLCCFPCCAILINIEQLLLLIRQDPEVSRSGGPVAQTPLHRPSLHNRAWGTAAPH